MKIVIAGAGEVGSHLAKMLNNETNEVTVIDSREDRLEALTAITDVLTVEGNPSAIHTLKEAGADHADLFIAVNPSESQDVNIVSAMLAKKLGSKKVTARINNEEYLNFEYKYMFTEMGIDLLFYPEKIATSEITDLLRRTATTESLEFARGKLQVAVFKLEEDSQLLGMNMAEFSAVAAAEGQAFRVVAITRKDTTIVPTFDTRFKYHDLVFIISTRDGMNMLMRYIGKHEIEVKNLMILGGSPIGEMLAMQLSKQMDSIKLIDMNKAKCLDLAEKLPSNVIVVNGDGRNSDLMIEESIREYDAFVAVTNNSETNILACVAAKTLGVERTIAEVENLEYIKLAERMGVDAVVNKKLITAGRIFKFTLSNKVRFIKYMSGTNAEVLEYIVAPDTAITKKPLKEMNFPKGAIIGGIIRGNESFIAVGDTHIQAYDRVAVFSLPEIVKEVDSFFK
jgi:trk system potassium uptake protein TrkA